MKIKNVIDIHKQNCFMLSHNQSLSCVRTNFTYVGWMPFMFGVPVCPWTGNKAYR